MEKILITTDLSAKSKSGIKFAFQLASQLKAEIIVLYVAEVTKPTSWSDQHYARFFKETKSKYIPKLEDMISKTLGRSGKIKNVKYAVELSLNVSEAIIAAAKRNKVSFICMSTRGAGKVKKLFGTNATSVLTTSPIPVIVVPEKYIPEKIDKVLFASDFADLSREMKTVSAFADKLKATTKVVHFDYLLHVPENLRRLEIKSEKFTNKRTKFEFKKMNIENTLAFHLSEAIKSEKPSVIVLFTKQNRNWYDKLLLPSEASEIAFNPKVPLLTYKKKG